MHLAHTMMGVGMLLASSLVVAADDAAGCLAPQGAVLAAAQAPLVHKFSLSLQGCAMGDAARASAAAIPPSAEAAQLQLYDSAPLLPAQAAPVPAGYASSASTAGAARPAVPGRTGRLNAAQQRLLSLAPKVQRVAAAYDIDPLLLHAIAHVESRHNPQAVSHAGALGVMQVMPATARRFGVGDPRSQLLDPDVSLEVSSAYLKTLQGRFGNNLALVLAAYNAGEGAVERHGRSIPPYAETRGYVQAVLAQYRALRASLGATAR
ncbi:lytic transglycosylase domain-containing protein [Ideonella sp. BN130291]|uniref:lytic transglycosylase domain-containing protein n=1 Tax=Ideonella sp. BN130291 TaxID=3112940 RepID=UPI002E259A88|nr:lytic transglycosylase domain-containing protein [Ideonella sp. BN130291]